MDHRTSHGRRRPLTLALASTQLLGFMKIPPDWQVAANGAILIIVLAARIPFGRAAAQQ